MEMLQKQMIANQHFSENWLNGFLNGKLSNLQTRKNLSKQTTFALVTALRCTATLTEDLLQEGYAYVLTAQFHSDPWEWQFSKYCPMSGK